MDGCKGYSILYAQYRLVDTLMENVQPLNYGNTLYMVIQ